MDAVVIDAWLPTPLDHDTLAVWGKWRETLGEF